MSRREQFLEAMDATIPWSRWVGGYDSYAMRKFMGLDFGVEQVPDATTLLGFRHLLETHELGRKLFESQNEISPSRAGSCVEVPSWATIIAAPSSTKDATGTRDPEMHQTKKGNQWSFGMKAHIGVDAGTGYVHSVSATSANVHDLDETAHLVRDDDEVVYTDAGYQGVEKRPEVTGDEHLSAVEFRVAARKAKLAAMAGPSNGAELSRRPPHRPARRKPPIISDSLELYGLPLEFSVRRWVGALGFAGPPEPVAEEESERGDDDGADQQSVEQNADAHDDADLGQRDQRQHS
ncbi:IS5 family transposase, partial [Kribbella italica]|nr:IS5 family transposase [Kribbella italica]